MRDLTDTMRIFRGFRPSMPCRYENMNARALLLSGRYTMNLHLDIALLQPVIALIAGILILIAPHLLNYVVALYLIVIGVSGVWPHLLG